MTVVPLRYVTNRIWTKDFTKNRLLTLIVLTESDLDLSYRFWCNKDETSPSYFDYKYALFRFLSPSQGVNLV